MEDHLRIDEIFDLMEKQHIEYLTGRFICSRCNKEKPLYHSVLLPERPWFKIGRVCENCFREIYKELSDKTKRMENIDGKYC